MQSLKILCRSFFSVETSCKTALQFKYHHIFGFMACVAWRPFTWLVYWTLRNTRIVSVKSRFYPVRFLWGWTRGKAFRSKSRTLDELEQIIVGTLAAVFFLRKFLGLCLPSWAPGSKPRQDQIYEIFSVPIPKISERGNHKWCNLWRSSRVHILGYAYQ